MPGLGADFVERVELALLAAAVYGVVTRAPRIECPTT
jgi:hypothetical protein